MLIKTAAKQDVTHLLILLTIALGIGIYLIATTVVIAKDGIAFIEYAKNLEIDHTQTIRQEDDHPGYPAMILGVHKTVRLFAEGKSVFSWIYSAQATAVMFRLFTIVVLYFIGKTLVGAKFSFWAVLILIFLPKPAGYGSDALSDWPHLFFLATGFLLLIRAAKNNNSWLLFGLVGISSGLGYLVRPECAQLVIYGSLWLGLQLFRAKRTLPMSKTVLALALLLAGFLVLAGPHISLKNTIFSEKQISDFVVNAQNNGIQFQQQAIALNTADIIASDIVTASGKLFENIGETLMWFFVPALLIGVYKFVRNAKWYEPEHFFISAIIIFNVPLMIWLYCSAGYMSARHTLPLVMFTVFYIPAGMYVLADLFNKKLLKKNNANLGFVILIAIGTAICVPKLLRPLHFDKITVRKAAQWLTENSEKYDIIAEHDSRVAFYANRKSIYYDGQAIPQEAKYVVKVFKNQKNTAADNLWGQYRNVFSYDNSKGRIVVIYEKTL